MKNKITEEEREYVRNLVKNLPKPEVNYELLYKVKRLASTLCFYADCKKHKVQNIEILEEKLKSYEDFLDRKYWNFFDLLLIIRDIGGGEAQTIEQAVALLEKRNGKRKRK